MSAVSTILLIVLLSLTNQSSYASYSSLLTQQQQQQQQQNQTSGTETTADSYNWTMRHVYDDVILPRYNENIDIFNNVLRSCDINKMEGSGVALQECYIILKNITINYDNLRLDHNATIDRHYENGLELSALGSLGGSLY